jgi:periplasmic protein TonB
MVEVSKYSMLLCLLLPLAACTSTGLVPEGQSKETSAAAASSQGEARAAVPPAVAAWKMRVYRKLASKRNYPAAAIARREQGTVHVRFSLDRRGHLVSNRIVRGSGFAALDNAALELVRQAQPFPPPPAELPAAQLNMSIPIDYTLSCGAPLAWLWSQCVP